MLSGVKLPSIVPAARFTSFDIGASAEPDYKRIFLPDTLTEKLAHLPRGSVELNNIPFVSGAKDNRPSFLMVERHNRDMHGIPIGKRLNSLIFLHFTTVQKEFNPSWRTLTTVLPRDIIGYYRVIYDDGFLEWVPIEYGLNISTMYQDWKSEPGTWWGTGTFCYYALPAWRGRTPAGEPITLYSFEWMNPYPEKQIREIDFQYVSMTESGIIGLAAITGVSIP
jgi:hypothetical protein